MIVKRGTNVRNAESCLEIGWYTTKRKMKTEQITIVRIARLNLMDLIDGERKVKMMNDKAPEFWVTKPDNSKEDQTETQQIINWLRDKACRADNPSWTRMMNKAADRLKELDQAQNQKTGHWMVHITSDDIWAECSECHVCGHPQWKVCPVCETRMVNKNAED